MATPHDCALGIHVIMSRETEVPYPLEFISVTFQKDTGARLVGLSATPDSGCERLTSFIPCDVFIVKIRRSPVNIRHIIMRHDLVSQFSCICDQLPETFLTANGRLHGKMGRIRSVMPAEVPADKCHDSFFNASGFHPVKDDARLIAICQHLYRRGAVRNIRLFHRHEDFYTHRLR